MYSYIVFEWLWQWHVHWYGIYLVFIYLICNSVLSWIVFFMYYPMTSSISNGHVALYGSDERIINNNNNDLLHTQNVCLFLFLSWNFPLCLSHLAKESVPLSMPFQNLFYWISFVFPSFSVTYYLLIAFVIILIFLLYIFLVMLGLILALVFCHYSSMPSYSVTYALINLSSKDFIVRCIYFFGLMLYRLCYFLLHILKFFSHLQSVCWYLHLSLSVILLHVVMWPLTDAYSLRHFLFAE